MLGTLEANPSASAFSCANVAERSTKSIWNGSRGLLSPTSSQLWIKGMHSGSRRGQRAILKRNKTSSAAEHEKTTSAGKKDATNKDETATGKQSSNETSSDSSNYFHLPHLPKLPHRPTKEELLAAATGFWSRLRVRFKWLTIRSTRPWNVDDWSAFVSWFLLGHIVWILVGTTTFFSLVVLTINTVVAQGISESDILLYLPTDILQKHWLDGWATT